jgi:DNA-binding MarR family transcriptional regulator
MKNVYIETTLLIERLHRRFLDVVKAELDKLKIEDLNNVQTLILYNIGTEEITVGELTNRGYYLGSNVSYNVKKMVENGYLVQERSPHDKRSVRVRVSPKGLEVCQRVDDLNRRHIEQLRGSDPELRQLAEVNRELNTLERFWTECVSSSYRPL